MKNKKTLVSAFNLYKGGSLALFMRIENDLANRNDVISLVSSRMHSGFKPNQFIIKYPLKYFNPIYRMILEQFIVPLLSIINGCNHIVMMGNFASFLWFGRQTVYFHNTLYLSSSENEKLIFRIEKFIFILSIRYKKPRVFVQSQLIAKRFKAFFPHIHDLHVSGVPARSPSPIANTMIDQLFSCEEINFIYPAFAYSHKNHKEIISLADFLKEKKIKIYFTISEKDALNIGLEDLFKHSCFVLLGNQANDMMELLYSASDALIFPSLDESLGLPLIEATEYQLPIIAPNLPYVKAAINNFYSYNSLCRESLIDAISKFLEDLKCGNLKISTSKIIRSSASFLNDLTS